MNIKINLYHKAAKTHLMFLHITFGMLPVTVLAILTDRWSMETLQNSYQELIKAGYLLQKKSVNLKLTYVSSQGVESYNDYLYRQGTPPIISWPKPEHDIDKAESLAMQNELNVFFFLLREQSEYESTYYPRKEIRNILESQNIRAADNKAYSIYKGIWEFGSDTKKSGTTVYNFGSTNRDESENGRKNIQKLVQDICNCLHEDFIPLVIFGYNDNVPISIIDYSNKLRGKNESELSRIPNKHFRLSFVFSDQYATYYFPLIAESLHILSQWKNRIDWKQYCINLNNAWKRKNTPNSESILDCNLSSIYKLIANTERPLYILLHEHQISTVNAILAEAPNPEKVLLNPINPSEFAVLMQATSNDQRLIFPERIRPLEPAPQSQNKKSSKPPQKRQWKNNKPKSASFE